MSGSEEDFHFESAEEDDLVAVTKSKKGSKGAEGLEKPMETISISDSPSKSPAEIRKSLANEEANEQKKESEAAARKQHVLENLESAADAKGASGGWGWGSLSSVGHSLLSTASTSVSTFTTSVGEGFDKFVETVEYSLGAEDPEEFAKREYNEIQQQQMEAAKRGEVVTQQVGPVSSSPGEESAEKESNAPKEEKEGQGAGWLSGWGLGRVVEGTTSAMRKTVQGTTNIVQQTTGAVQKTGKNLVSGGLDMLETIGKKTYNVIAEGDHGLKTSIQSSRQKSSLSQLLREAKESAEMKSKQEEEYEEARKAHFGAQFDEFQGVVQLEALEMLSNQCEGKVQSVLGSMSAESLVDLKKELVAIKESFELKDLEEEDEDEEKDHDFDRLMNEYIGQLGLNITAEKIIHVQEKNRKWIMDCSLAQEEGTKRPPKEIHEVAIQALAEVTARSIEVFHKVGQLLLLEKNAPLTSYKTKANGLASTTRVLCAEVGIMSTKFVKRLNAASEATEEADFVSALITNVYLEATNSSTYIQDGFQLLLPVLQQSAISAHSQE